MMFDFGCCCGDVCTEFYCSPPSLPRHIYNKLFDAAIVVHVEDDGDCNHTNNYIAFDSPAEAERFAEEARSKGLKAEIITGEEARKIIEMWLTDSVVDDEEYRRIIAKELRRWLQYTTEKARAATAKPRLTVVLIDGSGSMNPAWFEAWDVVFRELRQADGPFAVLLFKHKKAVTSFEAEGVVVEGRHAAVIDVARLLRRQNLVRLPRAPTPEEVGVTFRGWTPLLEALWLTMHKLRQSYPSAEITLYVVSDNRDSMVARDSGYRYTFTDRDIVEAKRRYNIRLVLIPVGHYLRRYLEKYDEVLSPASDASSLLSMI